MNQANVLRGVVACGVAAMLVAGSDRAGAVELGAYIAPGYSFNTVDISRDEMDPTFEEFIGLPFDESSLDRSMRGYSLAVGYQLTRNFALEGAWINLGKLKYDFAFSDESGQLTGRFTSRRSGMAFAGVGSLPLGTYFSVEGRVGALFGEDKQRISVPDANFASGYNDGGTSLLFGVGATWFVTAYTGVSVGITRFKKGALERDIDQLSIGFRYSYGY